MNTLLSSTAKSLLVVLLAVFALSCEGDLDTFLIQSTDPDAISFTTSITSRASDTAFDAGDEISVTAYDDAGDVYAQNVDYSYANSIFSSTNPIKNNNNEKLLSYRAVYPYLEMPDDKIINFAVQTDQSVNNGYTLSDLMSSYASATTSTTPKLTFDHLLSKIIVNITSSDIEMINVTASLDVLTNVEYNLSTLSSSAIGSNTSITMASNGVSSYKAIVVPQTFSSSTAIGTIDINGQQFNLFCPNDSKIQAGKQYTINATIKEGSVSFDSPLINDWVDIYSSLYDDIVYPDFFPEWSWENVPVCMHLFDNYSFTDQEAEFIAQFPLICLEKQQGRYSGTSGSVFQGTDIGTSIAATQLKKYNPKTKVLSYQSFRTDYGVFSNLGSKLDASSSNPADEVREDWALVDKNGAYTLVSGTYRVLDPRIEDARLWWKDNLYYWAHLTDVDGIFVDAYSYIPSESGTTSTYGSGVYADWLAGNQLKRELVETYLANHTITLGNCLENTNDEDAINESFEYLESVNGGMMEHFCIIAGEEKEHIARAIQTIRDIGRKGKMCVIKGWPRYTIVDDVSEFTYEYLEECAREDIVFPLACFLCGAGKYAYFCYSWQYGMEQGCMIDYEEYFKKLGQPLEEYQQDGYVFTREFEYASVWVDLDSREAKITWDE